MNDIKQPVQQVQDQQNQTQSLGKTQDKIVQENTLVDFTKSQVNGKVVQNQQPIQGQVQHPTGTSHPKESEPMPSLSTVTEWMKPAEQQIELEPEVESAGVELVTSVPQISQQEKDAGVKLAKETMPMEKEPIAQIPFPMSQTQAQQITKGSFLTKDTSNPMLWLALLIVRQFQMVEKQKENIK